jgi:hypothetical protein
VALLMVLGALVLVAASLLPLARSAGLACRDRRLAPIERQLDDLLDAAEAPVILWLHERSQRIVLPPDDVSPRVLILNDTWRDGEVEYGVSINAFDELGMMPIRAVGRDCLMTGVLPEEVISIALYLQSSATSPSDASRVLLPLGLDQSASRGFPIFPEPVVAKTRTAQRQFVGPTGDLPKSDLTSFSHASDALALGELLATHPAANSAGPSMAGASRVRASSPTDPAPFRINVNTAPMPLVRVAMLSAGRGGVDAIARSRAAGRPFLTSSESDRRSGARDGIPIVEIVSFSNCWAFRVDLRAGPLRRSWWSVYVQNGSTWERVQRLAITE